MRHLLTALVVVSLLVLFSGSVSAQQTSDLMLGQTSIADQRLVTDIKPGQLQNWLDQNRIPSIVLTSASGDTALVLLLGNIKVNLYFYDPEIGGGYHSLRLDAVFEVGTPPTDELMAAHIFRANLWNLKYRLSRAYVDTDGSSHLDNDLVLNAGVTWEGIGRWISNFRGSVVDFNAMLNR